MKITTLIIFSLIGLNFVYAQVNLTDTVPATINYVTENEAIIFNAGLRPLRQIAGAPAPFYTYLWEFGDGTFSFEKSPPHFYKDSSLVDVRVFATNNYDDGGRPPTRPVKIKGRTKPAIMAANHPNTTSSFFKLGGSIELKSNCMPKPNDDMVLILGYRNIPENGLHNISGTIAILYNDIKFSNNNFLLEDVRTYHKETQTNLKSKLGFACIPAQKSNEPVYYASLNSEYLPSKLPTEKILLKDKVEEFKSQQSWHFENLGLNQERFLFINLKTTPQMLKDTNATVKISAVFIPDDATLQTEYYNMELQIVASHDPNKMGLKHSRMNYRMVGKSRELTYKVRFQNTGKGPAKKVNIAVLIPKIFDQTTIKITSTKPYVTSCDSAYKNQSCIETLKGTDSVRFVFNNIYLPGTQQDGVNDADSTMGFVEYKIKFKEKPKKLPIVSGAAIIFDKNLPIYTNRAVGRFKMGLSPGLILGYGFPIKTNQQIYGNSKNLTVGASLAPYSPHKFYWQAELFANNFTESRDSGKLVTNDIIVIDNMKYKVNTATYLSTQKLLSINAVPLQLRYNINKFIGAGIGGLIALDVYNKTKTVNNYELVSANPDGTMQITYLEKTRDEKIERFTNLRTSYFADVQLGLVHVGPSMGFRYFYEPTTTDSRFTTYIIWKF